MLFILHFGLTVGTCCCISLASLYQFLPCAKCPVMCFVTHPLLPSVLSLSTLSMACTSISTGGYMPKVIFSLQSYWAGLFIASHIALWCCLATFLLLISSLHGSNGKERLGCFGVPFFGHQICLDVQSCLSQKYCWITLVLVPFDVYQLDFA